MQLPKNIQQRLASEFRFAVEGMIAATDGQTQLYYFSAFYGVINRALNEWWSAELGLLHHVLHNTHTALNTRAGEFGTGINRTIRIPENLPTELNTAAQNLTVLFEGGEIDNQAIYALLARFAELAYVATGNGYYLYLQGQIKV